MSWEHELAMRIKAQGKTGGIETGYLVGEVISPKWSEADEAWTDGELIISTLEGQAMLTEGMLDRLDAGGELHDGMTVALIPGARALRGGQRFFVAEIPGHGALPGRDSPDCHPIEAITGLRDELNDHDDRLDHLETIRVPALEHDMNEAGGRVPVLEGRVEALEDLESALGEDLSDLSDRVDDIVTHGGEPNVIETVKRNGVALPVSGKAVDVSVPTKVSQLTNDSGYISQESDPTVPAWAKEASKPSYTAEEVGALPDTTEIPSRTSDLTNDSGFLTQETDPTVPAWAKAASKPSYTAQEVGAAEAGHTHPYLPLTGGTLSGGLAVRPAGVPQVALIAPEKEGVGRSRTTLYKNASAAADYGTMLVDYVWGDASTSNARVALVLNRNVSLTKNLLRLVNYDGVGTSTTYLLYGEHNPPAIADVTGLQAALSGKSDTGHGHMIGDVSGLQTALDGKAASSHSHAVGDVTGLQAALNGKSDTGHGHVIGDVSGLQTALDGKAASSHSHAVGDVTGLQTALNGKSDTGHGHAIGDVSGLQTALDGKAASSHSHAVGDVTGLQAALNGKSDTGHGHVIGDVSGLQTALDGKAASSHTHNAGDITGTLSADRLPVVPIAKGGTGQTDALAAITALGGLSAASVGTPIASGDDIDSYLTPGTYWSENSTISASLQGTPPWTGGGFKLFVVKSHTNRTFFQLAIGASAVGIRLRAKPNEASPWGDWVDLSTSGHTHGSIRANGSIAEDTAPGASDRLVITDASDGSLIKRGDIRFDGTTTDRALTPKGTWESFLPLSGGTLTGNLTLDPTGNAAPVLTLVNAEKEGVGASRVQLRKNASASGDYGSMLTDFTWGDETTATKYARLTLWAAAGSLPAMLQLTYNNGAGSSKGYQLYGDHNRPMLDGQTVMTGSEDLNTMTSYGWYRCRTNTAARTIKHTPGFDATTLVNPSLAAFNLTVGRIASDYVYQEALIFNTGKRWYRYTSNPTAASPTWSAWTEH